MVAKNFSASNQSFEGSVRLQHGNRTHDKSQVSVRHDQAAARVKDYLRDKAVVRKTHGERRLPAEAVIPGASAMLFIFA
jgi:hypothetical protein